MADDIVKRLRKTKCVSCKHEAGEISIDCKYMIPYKQGSVHDLSDQIAGLIMLHGNAADEIETLRGRILTLEEGA